MRFSSTSQAWVKSMLAIIGKRSFLDAADVLDVAELGEMGQSSGFAAHMLCTD